MFASLESGVIEALSPLARSLTVLFAEGDLPDASHAEETRVSLGLLGLVEPRAWSSWQRGLFVAWGVFGRVDIATMAGLVLFANTGLQPPNDREALPNTLARFLIAAEAVTQGVTGS